jgi:GT2 family glycosyltransferase
MDFTVAICTFNGAKRLPNVLDRLQEQVSTDFLWEIILIDNASTDDTATIIPAILIMTNGWSRREKPIILSTSGKTKSQNA